VVFTCGDSVARIIINERCQFVVKKRSASKERESKCSESKRISKLRSPDSCWNTPGPQVAGDTFSRRSEVLILTPLEEMEERKVSVSSSEERLAQILSILNPKPRFSTSESKTDANDAGFVSCRESGRVGRPSSVFVGVCISEVVQRDVTDEGVQEAERRVGVGQLESSKVRDMGEEAVGEAGDEKEKSFCKLSIEKRRPLVLKLVVAAGIGEPALRRTSSCRGSFS